MSRYREQLVEAVEAVEIIGPSRYSWLGSRSRALPAGVRRDLTAHEERAALHGFLAQQLYWSFYCRGAVVRARWLAPEAVSADPRLALAVASAGGRERWARDWIVERVQDRHAVVAMNGLRARVPNEGALTPGADVSLPAAAPAISPGYRSIVGAVGDVRGGLVRVYWQVTCDGAAPLVRALTARLDAEGTPFRLKVADHPSRFDRCDAAVLYVDHAAFVALRPWLASLARNSAATLRPRVPAFTLPLAPGVGLAEEVGGDSFGQRRCALLADGILEAHERGAIGTSGRAEAVVARFARAGIDIRAPYLEPSLAGRHVF